jgi:PBSX family phage terminase large subunit
MVLPAVTAAAMLESKRYRVEDVFRRTIESARLQRQREDERRRELERLEKAEREKPAVVPVVQNLNRHVLPWALPLQQPARYKGASGGRGSGKSHFFAEEAVEAMVRKPSLRVACIREVQRSLALSVKSLVEEKIRQFGVGHLFEITGKVIRRLDGDGLMIFEGMQDHTADTIKSLEGFGIAWVEEAQRLSERSMALLTPTIRRPGAELWFSWNPEQPTDAVDALFTSLENDPLEAGRFVRVRCSYLDNPLISDDLLKDAARDKRNDEEAYEHIWLGGYNLGGHGRVYSRFKNKEQPDGNLDESIEDLETELLVGMDFNVNPMSAVIAQRVVDECEILDAIEIMTSNTEEMARELKERYPNRTIVICPDPSGKQRRTSAPAGQTDFTILEDAGFEVRAPGAAPLIKDRVNNAQAMLFDLETERRRVRIHPDAKPLITALANLTFKEGTNQPNKKSGFDHITDAMGYLLWQEFNVLEEVAQWGSASTGLH